MATMRSKQLGRELRQLREAAGLSRDDVVAQLGWSKAKVERIEAGTNIIKAADLRAALDLYDAHVGKYAKLEDLRLNAKRRGWWVAFNDVFDGIYISNENDAEEIISWQPGFIPGLLQTEDYTRAITRTAFPDDPDEVERRVRARMARRSLLRRTDLPPPRFHAIIDEGVLRRSAGSLDVMRTQWSELWSMGHLPNVTIQISPLAAGAHFGMGGPFVLLSFAEPEYQDVAYIESVAGDIYQESPRELERLRLIWSSIKSKALSPEESATMLAELTKE